MRDDQPHLAPLLRRVISIGQPPLGAGLPSRLEVAGVDSEADLDGPDDSLRQAKCSIIGRVGFKIARILRKFHYLRQNLMQYGKENSLSSDYI
jgi:hypothetical protein